MDAIALIIFVAAAVLIVGIYLAIRLGPTTGHEAGDEVTEDELADEVPTPPDDHR